VTGLPALIFLEPDGEVRETLMGYLPPEKFKAEVARIVRNEGTISALVEAVEASPEDIDLRWELAQKYRSMGARKEYAEQLDAIRKLDPDGKSLAMRTLVFEEAAGSAQRSGDTEDLEAFLAEEKTHRSLIFEGWFLLARIEDYHRSAAVQGDDEESAGEHARLAFEAFEEAWKHVTDVPADRAGYGNHMAWTIYEMRNQLDELDLVFGLEVARKAVADSGEKDPSILDTLAVLQHATGDTPGAIATIEKAIALEPDEKRFEERLEGFRTEV
jgi:tetratricopeptide (TPR) repeat protein